VICYNAILPEIELPNGIKVPLDLVNLRLRLELCAAQHGYHSCWEPAREINHGIEDYLKGEYPDPTVTLAELYQLTAKALFGLGYPDLASRFAAIGSPKPAVIDLDDLADRAGASFELSFFPSLKRELEQAVETGGHSIHLRNMRDGVKRLLCAKRWSPRCRGLNEQIVEIVEQVLQNAGSPHVQVAMTPH
jgi:hypothetical protein